MPQEKHTMPHGLDYNQITDHIFIGTNMCCQTHFEEELLAVGVKADISLEEEHLDAPFGVEIFLWLPTKDLTAPATQQFNLGIAALKNIAKQDIKVYVHCRLGHGRAPTLVAGYLIKEMGMSVDEAIAFIKQRRPVIHLETTQTEALRKLA